jgi:hypothetical protein
MKVTSTIRVPKAKPQQKATILDVVNRLLNRKTAGKYIGQYVTTGTLPTGIAPYTPAVWENVVQVLGQGSAGQAWKVALPAQIQGLTDQTRIGDRIEPTAHQVKMTVRLARTAISSSLESPSLGASYDYFAQQTPLDLTVYIFYGYIKSMKTYQGGTAVTLTDNRSVSVTGQNEALRAMNKLLDNGDGTFDTFDGTIPNTNLPLSDYVDMKVKKIHLRQASGWINTPATSGANPPFTMVPNGDSQNTISKQVTLKFKPPSRLHYKTSTDIYPENYAPVFAVGYIYNDATASTNNIVPVYESGAVEYIANAQLWYKDHQ